MVQVTWMGRGSWAQEAAVGRPSAAALQVPGSTRREAWRRGSDRAVHSRGRGPSGLWLGEQPPGPPARGGHLTLGEGTWGVMWGRTSEAQPPSGSQETHLSGLQGL